MRAMTILTLPLSAAALIACAPVIAEPHLSHQGTIYESTDGVALFEDQRGGHAGMMGTTCAFSQRGTIGADTNIRGRGSPRVLDGKRDQHGGEVVLVRTRDELGLLDNNFHVASAPFEGLTDAVFTRDGIVAIGGCMLRWLGGAPSFDRAIRLDGPSCDSAVMTVDRETSTAFVTAGNEVVRLDHGGHASLGFRADRVGWSPTLDAVLLTQDSGLVQAVTPDGDLLWTTDLDPENRGIRAFQTADLGPVGRIAVTTRGEGGALYTLDAFTGEILSESSIGPNAEIVASSDGTSLAIVGRSRVDLYALQR